MKKLIDFWAPWCMPCRVMGPIIEELQKELSGKVEFVKINVDENPGEASKFGVMGIPTFVMMDCDKETGRKTGVTGKEELIKLIGN